MSVAPPTLDRQALRQPLRVIGVEAPGAQAHQLEWLRWLEEIGFIAGEPVMLLAQGQPGGDPLVVRVGSSTFALRRAEAACVRVEPVEALA